MDRSVLVTAFLTLFLTEIGDKTQLAVLALSASSQKPMSVFLGALVALALVTAVGAMTGYFFAEFLPKVFLQRFGAAVFLAVGFWMLVHAR